MVAGIVVVGVGVVVLLAFSLYQWHLWHQGHASREETSEGGSERAPLLKSEPPVAASEEEPGHAKTEAADLLPPKVEVLQHKEAESPDPRAGEVKELLLEVISGPSAGKKVLRRSGPQPPALVSIGRAPQNDLQLQDPEVSSLHAVIAWHPEAQKWQVTDKSSLNGTCLNGQPVGVPGNDTALVRLEGKAVFIDHGDVVTFGNSTKLTVRTSACASALAAPLHMAAPFGVAVASDPMTTRRGGGGKPLPMEDVSFCEWPLHGVHEFGLFCIFDGHAGRAAADNVSRVLPRHVSRLLQEPGQREAVLGANDAGRVLREAFRATEAEIPNEDEGCTATALLLWRHEDGSLSAQAANVGDSHCVFGIDGHVVQLTEDHRLTGPVERARLEASGHPLREGESRLCGMNIARVLGDKFLKAQDIGLSASPYVSDVLTVGPSSSCVAVIASDGLWDVISPKRCIQLASEARSSGQLAQEEPALADLAQLIASTLLTRAKLAKTVDNTTIVVLDFQSNHDTTFRTLKQASR